MTAHPAHYAPSVATVAAVLLQSSNFERIKRYCLRHGVWPRPDLNSPVMAPIAAFADLDVPQLATIDELAEWLFLPLPRLDYLADVHGRYEEHGETPVNHYHYVLQQKKPKAYVS